MKKDKVKVVILCGGRGTRLREETEVRPKPLVEIGDRPIIWHIMKLYSHFGFKDFILCLGYKGEMIKEYFLNYEAMNNDFTISLGSRSNITFHNAHLEKDWNVTLVNTGAQAGTGARIKKIEEYIDGDTFMVTYGDGVGDVDIRKLLEFHHKSKAIGTLTGVHPSSRFGELVIRGKNVREFKEKPLVSQGYISGGFFVFNRKFFRYLNGGEELFLEQDPLTRISAENQLSVYKHDGFWQCMDTQRELNILNDLWNKNKAPWRVWKD